MKNGKNIIGITMGCPVGIGPEIILRFFAGMSASCRKQYVVLGDRNVLTRCADTLKVRADVVSWLPGQEVEAGKINVMELSGLPVSLNWGQPNVQTGKAMAGYIETAVTLLQRGHLGAMVTCPITKSGLQAAGYAFPGHTEMLASLCGASSYGMLMAGERLRVSLVTIHCRLAEVPAALSQEEICRTLLLTACTLRDDFGINTPRLAVAALNPHAGEDGMFGGEEREVIAPAIESVKKQGFDITGPLPPDTVFYRAAAGQFDGVVCMYHDQGLIPFKLLHFRDGVNVTMGLPIIRTSVDHGTAYDIAGKGLADPSSLEAACKLALRIKENRAALGAL